MIHETRIAHGVILRRFPLDNNPDSVGSIALWERPVKEIFVQLPFNTLFSPLTVEVLHLQRPEAADLRDIDPNTPGDQPAAAVTYGNQGRMRFSVDHITPEQRVLTFAHEFGHYFQGEKACRLMLDVPEVDDITRLMRVWWDANRPKRGHNTWEDWAECCRAIIGCDRTRGYFSNSSTPASLKPELKAFIRSAYWLSQNLAGKKVQVLKPITDGCLYYSRIQERFIGFDQNWQWKDQPEIWRWRFISSASFRGQEWDGQKWISI